jgi:hypothetical protein
MFKLRFVALFIVILIILLTAGCSGSKINAPTGLPTYPTLPSDTIPPIPTMSPQAPEPPMINVSGSGDQVTDKFQLLEGLSIFTMKYNGPDTFIVWLMDDKGRRVDSLANTTGAYDGSQAAGINSTGNYFLNLRAFGPWSITIAQPRRMTGPSIPITLSGNGPDATGFILMDSSPTTFKMRYDGTGDFRVKLLDNNGRLYAELANETGANSGSRAIYHIPGYYLLNVQANGNWQIQIGQF